MTGCFRNFRTSMRADSPPHPDRKSDPTSPRKRGEVKSGQSPYCGVIPVSFTTLVSFS
jgi:hypothetical protein